MFNPRSYKLLDIAIFDVVMTFLFAIVLQKYYIKIILQFINYK